MNEVLEKSIKCCIKRVRFICIFKKEDANNLYLQEGKHSFRIICYNILADTYADSDFSKDVLFPYCPQYALDMDYRKQLILKEIIGG